jgi:hypothetical protein
MGVKFDALRRAARPISASHPAIMESVTPGTRKTAAQT